LYQAKAVPVNARRPLTQPLVTEVTIDWRFDDRA
jgi:hypothetical protein